MNDLQLPFEWCFSHRLSLIIDKAFTVVSSLTDKVSSIVTHFKHSTSAISQLQQISEELEETERKLVQRNKTRWFSTYNMFKSAYDRKESIARFFEEGSNIAPIEATEWGVIRRYIEILESWKEISDLLQSSSIVTSSLVVPTVHSLGRSLESDPQKDSKEIRDAKVILKKGLTDRFPINETIAAWGVCTILDPRFRQLNDLPPEKSKLIKTILEVTAKDWWKTAGKDFDLPFYPSETIDTQGEGIKLLASWTNQQQSQDGSLVHEILRWCSALQISQTADPLVWWKENAHSYPYLAPLARCYLAIPASGACIERMWSMAGNIVTPNRNQLAPFTVHELMFLQQHWKPTKKEE